VRVSAGVESDRNEGGILERHIHFEDVVGRGEHHLFFIRHDHGLQHVDHLRDVRPAHTVGVAGKDVEVKRR
jgi:hypothetical protein